MFFQAHWEAKIHSQYEETHWHGERSYLEIRFYLKPMSSTYGMPFIYNLICSKMIALGCDSYCINGVLSVCDWNCLLVLTITSSRCCPFLMTRTITLLQISHCNMEYFWSLMNMCAPLCEFNYILFIQIAGGTGITPMLQVIEAILKNPDDKTQVRVMLSYCYFCNPN